METLEIERVTAATAKAELLGNGMRISERALANYGAPFLEKRRAYGNPDPLEMEARTIPQELYILPERIICSVNIRQSSPWELDYEDGVFFVDHIDGRRIDVTFPLRPSFYDYEDEQGRHLTQFVTLYGGGSLGLFIYGSCALVDMDKACQYCSIGPNRARQTDFAKVLSAEDVYRNVSLALRDTSAPVSQVMLNGGNFPDPDKSFQFYTRVTAAARRAIDESGRDIELHLIVFPPNDLSLLDGLKGLDVKVAMNSEVFTPALFAEYCPGKDVISTQSHMFAALARAAEVLGPGNVYSIIVGGLEAPSRLREGMAQLAANGVTPVINVFHADPGTPLAAHPVPSRDDILLMGKALQDIYQAHPFMVPFYMSCGRNALDTEAYLGLF